MVYWLRFSQSCLIPELHSGTHCSEPAPEKFRASHPCPIPFVVAWSSCWCNCRGTTISATRKIEDLRDLPRHNCSNVILCNRTWRYKTHMSRFNLPLSLAICSSNDTWQDTTKSSTSGLHNVSRRSSGGIRTARRQSRSEYSCCSLHYHWCCPGSGPGPSVCSILHSTTCWSRCGYSSPYCFLFKEQESKQEMNKKSHGKESFLWTMSIRFQVPIDVVNQGAYHDIVFSSHGLFLFFISPIFGMSADFENTRTTLWHWQWPWYAFRPSDRFR